MCATPDATGQSKSNGNTTAAHSSSSGLCFIAANTQSTHHSVPVHLQTCFASLPLVIQHTKKEVRTTAHIRRAGGSTLSGVRNNSFWPSTACVLKWSPWVAAYQRAAVIEWVAGITQPGFRTYTSHSKGRAHWASEIHCDTDCVRSCFDWDWMITIPPVLARIYENAICSKHQFECNIVKAAIKLNIEHIIYISVRFRFILSGYNTNSSQLLKNITLHIHGDLLIMDFF